ncbi:MAG: ROK family protein [Aureispira sp.]|nr:ROK family protein [Aureispira sp.]
MVVGIDIGGTNTAIGLIDQKGNVLVETTLKTANYPKIEAFVVAITKSINDLHTPHKEVAIKAIGIGAPNGNFYSGTIEQAPNLPWKGIVHLRELFLEYFDAPVFITNDANAAALGEMHYGAAKGLKNFMVVTLGTGVGSGFVVNGKLMYGHDGFAGELGHFTVEQGGRPCNCGRRGCLETYASATGIVTTALEQLSRVRLPSGLRSIPKNQLSAKFVCQAAEQGDALSLEMVDYTAEKLGFALANIVLITSPEAIVFFGGVANAGDLLLKPTKEYMEQNLLNIFKNKVQLWQSQVPENHAALLGAAALAWENIE